MSILALTSDTLVTSPSAGQIEYSSPIFAATPIGTQRGIVPTQQYYRLNSDLAGANATGAQNVFGVGVTLSSSTVYEFSMYFILNKTAGTTSHNISFGIGGTATVNNILYGGFWNTTTSAFTSSITSGSASIDANSTSAVTLTSGVTSAGRFVSMTLNGTVSVNAGGTFIPQYTLSAAPGGAYSTVAGSYIRIAPVGASGSATNVGTWA